MPAGLGHDPGALRAEQRRPGRGRQQGPGVRLGQPAETELREPVEQAGPGRGFPHREDDRDRVAVQAARHEREGVGGLAVQAMRVVDQAQQGLAGGLLGQQPHRGQADQETVRCPALLHAEGQPQRVALGRGQGVHAGRAGPEELVQGREAELHLGLDRVHPDDLHARGRGLGVVQQDGLADTGLASDDERAAVPVAGAGQDLVEAAAFLAASEQALHGTNLLPQARAASPDRCGTWSAALRTTSCT